jgi:hypothetical protein
MNLWLNWARRKALDVMGYRSDNGSTYTYTPSHVSKYADF